MGGLRRADKPGLLPDGPAAGDALYRPSSDKGRMRDGRYKRRLAVSTGSRASGGGFPGADDFTLLPAWEEAEAACDARIRERLEAARPLSRREETRITQEEIGKIEAEVRAIFRREARRERYREDEDYRTACLQSSRKHYRKKKEDPGFRARRAAYKRERSRTDKPFRERLNATNRKAYRTKMIRRLERVSG